MRIPPPKPALAPRKSCAGAAENKGRGFFRRRDLHACEMRLSTAAVEQLCGVVAELLTRRSETQSFDRLASDLGDEVEVLVEGQHCEVGDLCSGCHQQVGNGRRAVLAAVS